MPPKRKKRKQKDAKKVELFGMTFVEKEQFNIYIKSLRQRIDRRNRLIEKLDESINHYQNQLEKEEQEKHDAISVLNNAVEESKQRIDELRKEILNSLKTHTLNKEETERSVIESKAELQKRLDGIKNENKVLKEEFEILEDFKANRELKDQELKVLQESVEEETSKFVKEKDNLEYQTSLEDDSLKKDVVILIEKMGEKFRNTYNERMTENVVLIIRENVRIDLQTTEINEMAEQLGKEIRELRKIKIQFESKLKSYSDPIDEEMLGVLVQSMAWKQLNHECRSQNELLKQMSECQKQKTILYDIVKNYKETIVESEKKIEYLIKEEEKLIQQKNLNCEKLHKLETEKKGLIAVIKEVAESCKQGTNYILDSDEEIIEYLGKRQIVLDQLKDLTKKAPELTDINDFNDLIWMQHQVKMPFARAMEVDKVPLVFFTGDLGLLP